MTLEALLTVYLVFFGLLVGSYLNVVIHRLPRGLSTVSPRSRCPGCGAAIRARDNLPVVSFLLLRGRCRHCGRAIAWRYPLVELATAGLFVAAFLRFGFTPEAGVVVLFGCLMIVLATIDLEHYLLPDRITLPGLVAGLALQPYLPEVALRSALLAASLGGLALFAVSTLWWTLRREEGMGLGDVKMLAMVGAFLGLAGTAVALFFAFLTGAVVGLGLMALSRGGPKTRLPFGTFLAVSAILSSFFGQSLAEAYGSLL